jgi:hypothetical protein
VSVTVLHADEVSYPFPGTRFYCQSWWTCRTVPRRKTTWRMHFDSLLATSDDLSVLLPSVRHLYDIVVTPEPRWGRRRVPTWHGLSCRLGRVEMWLPVEEGEVPLRPFSLLVRVPATDPPGALPYVLLGTQFLQEYGVRVELEAGSGAGRLIIPNG